MGMGDMKRAVRISLVVSSIVGLALLYNNCGGGFESSVFNQGSLGSGDTGGTTPPPTQTDPPPTQTDPPPATTEWVIPSQISFVEGSTGTYDLAATLPSGVAPGGSFELDLSGPALPAGMTLSSQGVLSVGSATEISVSGVVFSYTEP